MFRLFRVLKEEGEDALRRSVWIVCAAVLFLIAIGFAGVALAFLLTPQMPLPAALLVSAGCVLAIAVACLFFAERHFGDASSVAAATAAAPLATATSPLSLTSLLTSGMVDRTTQALLLRKVQSRPASMLAIAAAAGIAVAALDAFDDD